MHTWCVYIHRLIGNLIVSALINYPFTAQCKSLRTLGKMHFKTIMGKGENAVKSIFSLSQNVFYPTKETRGP